ncbi:MAG: lysophospholipid acyltransferase family protein [Candidatus Limnocylindria bacterium]
MTWLAELIGLGMAMYLRLVARTCRVSGDVTDDQVVLAFWHEFNLSCFTVAVARRHHLPHASFSTRGFRGVVITNLLRRSGADVRVLTLPDEGDRSGARDFALRLARLSRAGYSLVVTPDGPFGPPRVAKPGALIVARESRLPIQPWAVSVRPAIRLTRRWDRQLVPLPFSRIRLVAGERVAVAPRERPGARAAEFQRAMDEVTAQAERR